MPDLVVKTMTARDWLNLRHLNEGEAWGDPSKMSCELVYTLDAMREYAGHPLIIHCGTQGAHSGATHAKGLAVDCHFSGLSIWEQFLVAMRFGFRGVGVYPWWRNPGLHLDMRTDNGGGLWGKQPRAVWMRTKGGVYTSVPATLLAGLGG